VPVLVRTWNLFHGNTSPSGRRAYLERMVRLAAADGPDILCLQEVPPWSLPLLAGWAGMPSFGDVAARPALGPLPSTAELGRSLTAVNPGLLRSAFSGQANAILVSRRIRPLRRMRLVLNALSFRRAQARWLRLSPVTRIAWAKERRVCQAVRARLPDGRGLLVANLHATSYPPDERLADAEILRAAVFADALAEPSDVCVLAGDFNARAERSRSLADLAGADWGFSSPSIGIDHILVRGASATPPRRWPARRRALDQRLLLSDHTPVDLWVS
jgi:endonuclease/exonuclease/phosphatase family metal-dependent hydrolase